VSALQPEKWRSLLYGGLYSDLFFERSAGTSIQWEDGKLEEIREGSDHGLGLRYLFQDKPGAPIRTAYGSLNAWDPAEAAALSRRLLEGEASRGDSKLEWRSSSRRSLVRIAPSTVSFEDKIGLLRRADAFARSLGTSVRQVSLTYAERERQVAVLNSDGEAREENRTGVLFSIHVVAEKDGLLQTGSEVLGSPKGFEALDDAATLRIARRAAERALRKLSAPPAPAGEMTVVVSSAAGGTLIHEAIGHSLEADHVQEGTSPAYRGKIGARVAPEFLTIIDDPALPFYRGSYPFDDEGVETKPTVLVEKGVLKDYIYDRVTAMVDGKPSNAHGRRESYHHRPIPRMSNLYIAPGSEDPAAILRSLERGLFVTRMGGGQVNTATGEFMFEVDEGFWVENGKIRHMVRDANLLGEGPELLRSIDLLGWDIGWGIGTCGKDGQGVPVADGQPTLRIPKILVGGRQE
jgi:TldD protein